VVMTHRKALERMWRGPGWGCNQEETTDPATHLTDFEEKPLLEDQPCKLSFETLTANSGDEVPIAAQAVKLFLTPDVDITPGCKIVVKRLNSLEREFTFTKSGIAGVFTNHQEILLTEFKGYA